METKQKKMVDGMVKFQEYSKECPDFRSLMLLLHQNGYPSLLLGSLQQTLNVLSTRLSVDPNKMDFLTGSSGDILTKEDQEVLLLLDEHTEFPTLEESGEPSIILEICCLCPDENAAKSEVKKITELIEKTAKIPIISFTWGNISQQQSQDKLSNIVKGLSTNGKLLADVEIKKMSKNLRKDRARKILSDLIEIERLPYPADSVDYLLRRQKLKKGTLMREVESLVECGAISPMVRLRCTHCRTVSPGFSVSSDLEKLEGKIFCPHCAVPYDLKKQIQAFSVNEQARHALERGLWLEEFVADILSDFGCMKVQGGVIVDTLEIDILATKHGEIVLVECKAGDVNFTDLTIFSHKVRAINPDRAIIITTSKVLPNAKKEIESIRKREEIEITQIEGSLKEIKAKLSKMMERIEKSLLANWIDAIFSGMFGEFRHRHFIRLRRATRIQRRSD